MNTKYEAGVILYSHKTFQPDLCTCVRARSKNLKFLSWCLINLNYKQIGRVFITLLFTGPVGGLKTWIVFAAQFER